MATFEGTEKMEFAKYLRDRFGLPMDVASRAAYAPTDADYQKILRQYFDSVERRKAQENRGESHVFTLSEYRKMSLRERNDLLEKHPDVYYRLSSEDKKQVFGK